VTSPSPTIRLLVCGSADRGDDGAAVLAAAHLLPRLEPQLRQLLEVRRCPLLEAADLIDVTPGQACVVLDTVVGVEAGEVVEVPLDELVRCGIRLRSSGVLPIEHVVRITVATRGALPGGTLVGIGGKLFGSGQLRSRALRHGMPAFEHAVREAIVRLGSIAP